MDTDREAQAPAVSGIVVADAVPGHPMTYVSPGFESLTGYSRDEVLGRSCSLLQTGDSDPRAIAVMREALAAGREAHVVVLNRRKDGSTFWNEVSIAPERGADGEIVRYIGVQKDVSHRLEAEARIEQLAYQDPVTGLANRVRLKEELETAMGPAAGGRPVALLFVDLDDFKRVNDRHGHHVGDALLRAVARRLRAVVRPEDLLTRQGGDEFLVLVRDLPADPSALATELAGRVVGAFTEPFAIDGLELRVRASVGASIFPRDARDADELLRHADHAMYVAKRGGKNGFHVHRGRTPAAPQPAPDPGFAPGEHVTELRRILDGELVTPVFQPIVDLGTRAVVGYEALARGPHGSALERPDRLFAAAAACGATVALDWTCRAAAVRAALAAGLGRGATLFLNCEPTAFDADVPPHLDALWARATAELDLMLEITERALTARPAELAREVDRHREEGRGIALDDLGAEIRSLAVLPLVEPDVVKLDLRLVQERPSTDQAAIVGAVAAEHERTGATVLAEGIETEAHVHVARALGATLGQGWLFGRPAPLPGQVAARRVDRATRATVRSGATPYRLVAEEREVGVASKKLLLPMSIHLEHQAMRIGEGAVILSAFQTAKRFTPATVRRYEALARTASLVAAFGIGLPEEPCPGVRGAHLEPGDALADEWSVVVLGPHFAAALVAVDLGDTGPDADRRFTFATVYDRGMVIAAARTLVDRIRPRAG